MLAHLKREFPKLLTFFPRLAAVTGGGGGYPVPEPEPGQKIQDLVEQTKIANQNIVSHICSGLKS